MIRIKLEPKTKTKKKGEMGLWNDYQIGAGFGLLFLDNIGHSNDGGSTVEISLIGFGERIEAAQLVSGSEERVGSDRVE